jgi:hypothetical protein
MKLQDLPVGARFEYQGRIFVKTGPITATAEDGGQRMIPRYADLRPLDPLPEKQPASRRKLDEAVVQAAFDEFYLACSRLMDEFSRPQLAAARQRFLAALK